MIYDERANVTEASQFVLLVGVSCIRWSKMLLLLLLLFFAYNSGHQGEKLNVNLACNPLIELRSLA